MAEIVDIKEQLKGIAINDAINSRRMADTLREGMTAALLKKADTMSASDILDAISKIETINKLAPYQEILGLLEGSMK